MRYLTFILTGMPSAAPLHLCHISARVELRLLHLFPMLFRTACLSSQAAVRSWWPLRPDLVACLDFNSLSRTGELEPLLRTLTCPKVMIDHHPQPEADGFELVFSETCVSSASELLFHVLMSMPDVASDASRLPGRAAESLMAGMTTDTNNFANSVFPSTFSMASALLAAGVDRDSLLSRLYNSYRESRFRAMGVYLKDKMRITEYGVAYSIFNREDIFRLGLKDGDTEGFVNLPLGLERVKMSIFLREDGGF